MGANQGKGGVVYKDAVAISEVQKWTYSEKVDIDTKFSKGDTNETYKANAIDGSGTIDVLLDASDTLGQGALSVGSEVTLHLYEGEMDDGYYELTGAVKITGHDSDSPVSGYETRTFSFEGVMTEQAQ